MNIAVIRRRKRAASIIAFWLAVLAPFFAPSFAMAADADVSWSFQTYQGPAGFRFRDSSFEASVNGISVPVDDALGSYTVFDFTGVRGRLTSLPGVGAELRLLNRSTSPLPMIVRFEPAELTNVELGSTVRLGDIVFVNGFWNNDEIPTRVDFNIDFESADSAIANLDFSGQLILKSNLSVDVVSGEPSGDAGADWIAFANAPELGSFRVFDVSAGQGRLTNAGRVELWATLGTGTFESLRNPRGGFLSASVVADPQGRASVADVALFSSVLPASRSAQVGQTVTAFATLINAGRSTASQCRISPPPELNADFFYQATDPLTNAPSGERDTPLDIPGGSAQSFFFGLTPNEETAPLDVTLSFSCDNGTPAPSFRGLNTLLFSATASNAADIVALAATTSNDGIVKLGATTRAGAFSVATINVGGESQISVSVDSNGVALPLGISFCETNSTTGACLAPPVPAGEVLTRTFAASASPTFAVFVAASEPVALDPAGSRVFLRFSDDTGVVRGSTSVAVQSLLPVASAGADVQISSAGEVELSGSSEAIAGAQIESAGWTQISGPTVDTGPTNTSGLSFTAPQVQCATTLTFSYSANYSNGLTSTDFVNVRVAPVLGGFNVNAGEEAVLLSAFTESTGTSGLSPNATGLLGTTNLDGCNLVSASWQQTAGTPVQTTPFALGMGLNIVAPDVSADEILEFEFSVLAADGQVETDRTRVKLAATQSLSGDALPTPFYRPFFATPEELFVRDFNNFFVLDRATGGARNLADQRVFLQDDGSTVPSGVSSTDPEFVANTGKFINWVSNSLIEIDPDRESPLQSFRMGAADLCCHNPFTANATELFTLTSRNFGESVLFRQNYTTEDELTEVATVLGNRFDLVADETTVYLHSLNTSNPSMVAVDLASGLQTSVLSFRTSESSAGSAPAFSATKLYWEAGGSLHEIDRATKTVREVTSGFDTVRGLAVSGDWVYAFRRQTNTSMDVLLRVNITSGQTETLGTLQEIEGIAADEAAVYVAFNSPTSRMLEIHRYVDGGSLELFALTAASSSMRDGIVVSGNTLVVLGSHITFIDLATGQDVVVTKLDNYDDIAQTSNAIWLNDGGQDSIRIPLGAVPEQPSVLALGDGNGFVSEQVLANDVLYFLDSQQNVSGGPNTYLVRAIDSNGENLRTLFSGDNQFEGLGVYGDSLVFLCDRDCGTEDVALVTLPVSGGAPTVIRGVGDNPRISHGNKRVIVATQSDGTFTLEVETGVVTDLLAVNFFNGRLFSRDDVIYFARSFSDLQVISRYELGLEGSLTAPQQLIVNLVDINVFNRDILDSFLVTDSELIFFDIEFKIVNDQF